MSVLTQSLFVQIFFLFFSWAAVQVDPTSLPPRNVPRMRHVPVFLGNVVPHKMESFWNVVMGLKPSQWLPVTRIRHARQLV